MSWIDRIQPAEELLIILDVVYGCVGLISPIVIGLSDKFMEVVFDIELIDYLQKRVIIFLANPFIRFLF